MRRGLATVPSAVVTIFFVLGMCWAVTTPPGGGVDEPSHFIRALGLAEGRLFGDPVPLDRPFGTLSGEQLERVNSEAGDYLLPGNLREPLPCNAFKADMPFACAQYPATAEPNVHTSYHARYLPGAYVLPAVFSTAGDSTWKALVASRVGMLVQNGVLLAVAAAALARAVRRGGGITTGAAMVAALGFTPLLMFLSATVSPSSTEILGVAAFTAAFVVAVRQQSSRWWWMAVLCAVMAAWARDLGGPAVVVGAAAVALTELAFRSWWRQRTRSDMVAAAVLIVAVIGAQVWQLVNKASLQPDLSSFDALWANLQAVATAVHGSIGLVGWLVVPMEPVASLLWSTVLVMGVAMALLRMGGRARWVVAGVAAVYVLAGVVVSSGMKAGGFALQARYLMPIAAAGMVVLVCAAAERGDETEADPAGAAAGRAAADRAEAGRAEAAEVGRASATEVGRLGWSWVRAALVVAAIGHFTTLLVWAQRNAIGLNGSAIDFDRAAWTPPLGWMTWLFIGGAASVAMALIALPSQLRARST